MPPKSTPPSFPPIRQPSTRPSPLPQTPSRGPTVNTPFERTTVHPDSAAPYVPSRYPQPSKK